jgi:transcriptional regulator with XRE-family HTH domain
MSGRIIYLSKNIAHLRKLRKMTQEDMADELGVKKSRLGAWEENRGTPAPDLLVQLSDYFRLPIDILLRNDLTRSDQWPAVKVGDRRLLFPMQVNSSGPDPIEYVSAKASAGYLNGYADPEYVGDLPVLQLPFLRHGKFRAFTIKGDSMLPLPSGSTVVGRFVEHRRDIVFGERYVVLTQSEGVVFKRLHADKNKRVVQLHSDSNTYEPYSIAWSEVLELWQFTCAITTDLEVPQPDDEIKQLLQQLEKKLKK